MRGTQSPHHHRRPAQQWSCARPCIRCLAAGQNFQGGEVQFPQQLPGPAVPAPRTYGANVNYSQHQQQSETLGALYQFDKVGNGFGIVEVATKRSTTHVEVVKHEPSDSLSLLRFQPQERSNFLRNLGTEDGVITAAAFSNVVQENRKIEGATREDLIHYLVGKRMIPSKLPRFEFG